MPYTRKNRNLYGGSQRQLNIALRKARQQQEQRERRQASAASAAAASGDVNDFEKININVPQDTYTNPSRSRQIMNRVSRYLPSFSSTGSRYHARSMPAQPVSRSMSQNNRSMVYRMTRDLEKFEASQKRTSALMNSVSKKSKKKISYPANLAGEILKSNPIDKPLFHMYCQQSLDNWKQFKDANGGISGVKRMSDSDLKREMKRRVLMLSDITQLRMMREITKTYARPHFLLKMLNYVLSGNDGGSKVQFDKDIYDQAFANSIPDAGSQLLNNIPEAGSHKLVPSDGNKTKSKSKKLTGPMLAQGKRTKRKGRKGRKPKKSSQRK